MGAKRFFFMIRCRLTATESRAVTCKVKSSLGCGLQSCQTRPVCIFLYIVVYIIIVACAFANVHNIPAPSPLFSRNSPNAFNFSLEISANQLRAFSPKAGRELLRLCSKGVQDEEIWEEEKESIFCRDVLYGQ